MQMVSYQKLQCERLLKNQAPCLVIIPDGSFKSLGPILSNHVALDVSTGDTKSV